MQAVLTHRQRNMLVIPTWVSEIRFQTEAKLLASREKFSMALQKIDAELEVMERFKGILCATGDLFCDVVCEVLSKFFGLRCQRDDKFIEDALILDEDDQLFAVLEMKGVRGGLKREPINQVDSHRERLGIDDAVPGILIINDFTDIGNFSDRLSRQYDEKNLDHAKSHNVQIIRTVELLQFMQYVEELSIADRRKELISAIKRAVHQVKFPRNERESEE